MLKLILCSFFFSFSLFAASPFSLDMSVGGNNQTRSYDKAESLISAFKLDEIKSLFPSYSGTEAVNMTMNFRGLPINLTYAGAGSTSLVLDIPSIGIHETFNGASRDDSNAQFKTWLKKDGGEALNKIMKKLAEVSPNDPVAGNPTSLMSMMVANDFNQIAFPNGMKVNSTNKDSDAAKKNVVGLEARLGQYSQASVDARTLTVPASYSVRFDFDPRYQLNFSLPVTYVQVGEAKSFNASLGAGLRLPMTDDWSLTPALGVGVVGSMDLGSVGEVASTSLTSGYDLRLGTCTLGITNMLGYYKTLEMQVGGYHIDPDIKNTVVRNGLLFSMPKSFGEKEYELDTFLLDTRFFGSPLYMNQYNEMGFAVGSSKRTPDLSKHGKIGASYLYSKKDTGFTVNFGYSF